MIKRVTQKLFICGKRNSYSKTDHDATFMRMQEDAMGNGQLKPANYKISKTRKYKNDIGKIENMKYDEERDLYICRNHRELNMEYIKHTKSKTGYAIDKCISKCKISFENRLIKTK